MMDERMTESERTALCRRIDELCAENERLRQENQSIGVAAYELGRKSMADENAKLREELEKWNRLAENIELPEYPVTEFHPKDLERENAKLRVERDEWRRVAVSKQDSIDHMRDANAENAKLRKENDTLCRRIDELCMENERLRNQHTARRIVVSDGGVGHCACSACGGAIDQDDAFCRHCGARMEGE